MKKKKNWVCKVTEKKNWVDKMAKCYELLRAVLAINYSTQTERDLVCVLTFIDRKELICEELIYPKIGISLCTAFYWQNVLPNKV